MTTPLHQSKAVREAGHESNCRIDGRQAEEERRVKSKRAECPASAKPRLSAALRAEGRDAISRYEVLKKELEAIKVELDRVLGPDQRTASDGLRS